MKFRDVEVVRGARGTCSKAQFVYGALSGGPAPATMIRQNCRRGAGPATARLITAR